MKNKIENAFFTPLINCSLTEALADAFAQIEANHIRVDELRANSDVLKKLRTHVQDLRNLMTGETEQLWGANLTPKNLPSNYIELFGFHPPMKLSVDLSAQFKKIDELCKKKMSRIEAKKPLRPEIIADAMHDKIHVDIGIGRPAKSVKVTAKQLKQYDIDLERLKDNTHHFNYRIVVAGEGANEYFSIREVWYNKKGKPSSWSGPMDPMSETLKGLKWEIGKYAEAFKEPIWREVKKSKKPDDLGLVPFVVKERT